MVTSLKTSSFPRLFPALCGLLISTLLPSCSPLSPPSRMNKADLEVPSFWQAVKEARADAPYFHASIG